MNDATEKKSVVVTGAAGYIGGQTVLQFSDAGYTVIGIDKKTPNKNVLSALTKYVPSEFSTDRAVESIADSSPRAIIHCAGESLVAPSIKNPETYFTNNFIRTKKFVDSLLSHKIFSKFIFSSSAAVYGNPTRVPVKESDYCRPISPYGQSKLMTEMMLASYHHAYDLDYCCFRYFNACGADPDARHGQPKDATHIIPRIINSIQNNTHFILNGKNYDTPDGTCVRDYVHVADIARAHLIAVEKNVPCQSYNLGNNTGISNLEIIDTAQEIIGKKLSWYYGKDRSGDPSRLITDSSLFNKVSGWESQYKINDMLQHAWNWHNKR